MIRKQELKICNPLNFLENYSWRSNEDEIYPKDIIYVKPPSVSSSIPQATLVIEFSNIFAPQRVEIFAGSDQSVTTGNRQSPSSYHHSIFNHIKTLYISPPAVVANKLQRMKLTLDLDRHENHHHFYRLLVFPSLNISNPHRICELLSVYLLFDSSKSIPETVPSPTSPPTRQWENLTEDSSIIPTPPKNPKKSFKSLFRRNQKIHIGFTPLSSSVLSALFSSSSSFSSFSSSSDLEISEYSQLTPDLVENFITKWMKRLESKQKDIHKNNFNLNHFHVHEMEWLSRSITTIQQLSSEDNEASISRRKYQRNSPYSLTSIQKLRNRLLQVLRLIQDPHYLVYTAVHQQTASSSSSPSSSSAIPLYSQWIQTEMSVQDILHEYYLPAHPALRHVHYGTPKNLLNLPSSSSSSSSSSPQPSQGLPKTTLAHLERQDLSLIQHFFLKLWIESCLTHTTINKEQHYFIFQFQNNLIHLMTEDSVQNEVLMLKETNPNTHKPDLLFYLHQYYFYSSLQTTISSFSDFQLLFQSDTYHYTPTPLLPSITSPPPAVIPTKTEDPPNNDSNGDTNGDDDEDEDNDDDDDSSIPDLDEIIEKAISDFISKDGFEIESPPHNPTASPRPKPPPPQQPPPIETSPPPPEVVLSTQPVEEEPPLKINVFIPTRKMRSILILLSSLPTSLPLSSSQSVELQRYRVSEVFISSSIIALHHLLKFDPLGKYWFESMNYVKRIHSGEYLQGGSVSLSSLEYSTIVYSLILVLPAMMIGRTHLLSHSHQLQQQQEMEDKLAHQTLYTLRSTIVSLSDNRHIGVGLMSAILAEVLRMCYLVLSHQLHCGPHHDHSSSSYFISLFSFYSNHEIVSKQFLCTTLAVLSLECLCQMVMCCSFDTDIDTSFTKASIETLGSLFLESHLDSKVREAADRLLRKCNKQFPKFILEIHQMANERKRLLLLHEEERRDTEERRKIEILEQEKREKERIEKKKRDQEEREREEKEREREEREKRKREEEEEANRKREEEEQEKKRIEKEKEEKYGLILKSKRRFHSVTSVVEELQKQREEIDLKERLQREKREKEAQEEYEREKERRIKELREKHEHQEREKKEAEEKEKKMKEANREEEERRRMEQEEMKQREREERMKQMELKKTPVDEKDEEKTKAETETDEEDKEQTKDLKTIPSDAAPTLESLLKNISPPPVDENKEEKENEEKERAEKAEKEKEERAKKEREEKEQAEEERKKKAKEEKEKEKEEKKEDEISSLPSPSQTNPEKKKKRKSSVAPPPVTYEWQERKKKSNGGGCTLL